MPEEMCSPAARFPDEQDAFTAINDTSAAKALLSISSTGSLDRSPVCSSARVRESTEVMMRRIIFVFGAGLLVAGCSDRATQSTAPRLDALFVELLTASQAGGNGHNLFLQQLAGENEVPPRDTPAHGSVVVRLTE